ncbi:hypothetical protein D1007_35478 [Hordeum vulgare]|nr:hypothetical protein D1007_35478 [Hordeum vulgare]
MASSSTGKDKQRSGALSPCSARARAIGKLDIFQEEATPLTIDDSDEASRQKWLFAGENMFAAEFEAKRVRDRVLESSPWHINKHGVILQNFEEQMQPSELKFDRVPVWVRIVNLPYNPRNNKWGLVISQQIDKTASTIQIDRVGRFCVLKCSLMYRNIFVDGS